MLSSSSLSMSVSMPLPLPLPLLLFYLYLLLLTSAPASCLVLPSPPPLPHTASSLAPFPNPLLDPFYTLSPINLSSYSLGQIIDYRQTNSTFINVTTNLQHSYQLKFRSQDALQRPIAAITTVLIPIKEARTETGRHASLLSYQNFQDSISLTCSPSWAYVANSHSNASAAANIEAPIVVGWALDQGYYVVIPDHQGPSSSFLSGTIAAHIVLDSIRAALTFQNLSRDQTQIGLYGYSGGANAAIFASAFAEAYAPELNMVGVTSGGTPISPSDGFYFLNGGTSSGLAGAGSFGLASAYPQTLQYLESILSEEGRATLDRLRGDGICLPQVNSHFANINWYNLVQPPHDYLQDLPVRTACARETLLQSQASYDVPAPRHPVLIYHGLMDEVVPFNTSQAFINEQCLKGANIHTFVYPIGSHVVVEAIGTPLALHFLHRAFAGKLEKVQCGTTVPEITLGDSQSIRTVGKERIEKLLIRLNATSSLHRPGFTNWVRSE